VSLPRGNLVAFEAVRRLVHLRHGIGDTKLVETTGMIRIPRTRHGFIGAKILIRELLLACNEIGKKSTRSRFSGAASGTMCKTGCGILACSRVRQ
jgi:hypothetical protein